MSGFQLQGEVLHPVVQLQQPGQEEGLDRRGVRAAEILRADEEQVIPVQQKASPHRPDLNSSGIFSGQDG